MSPGLKGGHIPAGQVCDCCIFAVYSNLCIGSKVGCECVFLIGVRGTGNRHCAGCLRTEPIRIAIYRKAAFLLVGFRGDFLPDDGEGSFSTVYIGDSSDSGKTGATPAVVSAVVATAISETRLMSLYTYRRQTAGRRCLPLYPGEDVFAENGRCAAGSSHETARASCAPSAMVTVTCCGREAVPWSGAETRLSSTVETTLVL